MAPPTFRSTIEIEVEVEGHLCPFHLFHVFFVLLSLLVYEMQIEIEIQIEFESGVGECSKWLGGLLILQDLINYSCKLWWMPWRCFLPASYLCCRWSFAFPLTCFSQVKFPHLNSQNLTGFSIDLTSCEWARGCGSMHNKLHSCCCCNWPCDHTRRHTSAPSMHTPAQQVSLCSLCSCGGLFWNISICMPAARPHPHPRPQLHYALFVIFIGATSTQLVRIWFTRSFAPHDMIHAYPNILIMRT